MSVDLNGLQRKAENVTKKKFFYYYYNLKIYPFLVFGSHFQPFSIEDTVVSMNRVVAFVGTINSVNR